jgi:hypothetical protein
MPLQACSPLVFGTSGVLTPPRAPGPGFGLDLQRAGALLEPIATG